MLSTSDDVSHCSVCGLDNVVCAKRTLGNLPFNHVGLLGQDEDLSETISTRETLKSIGKLSYNMDSYGSSQLINNEDIDPDLNLLENMQLKIQHIASQDLKVNFEIYKNLVTIMHVNARSIVNKINDLSLLLMQLPVKILAFTETWLNKDNENTLVIPGYNKICKSREGRMGGGVALLVSGELLFYEVDINATLNHST